MVQYDHMKNGTVETNATHMLLPIEGYLFVFRRNPTRIPVSLCFGMLPCCGDCFRLATQLFGPVPSVSTLRQYQNVLILPQSETCLLRILFPLSRSVSFCFHLLRTAVSSPSKQRRNTRNTNPATVSIRPYGCFYLTPLSKCFDIAARRNMSVTVFVPVVALCFPLFPLVADTCFVAVATATQHPKHKSRNRVNHALH